MSNYEDKLNKPLLDAGWRLEKKKNCCSFTNNKEGMEKDRTECLYLSPRVMEQQNRLF